MIPDDLYQAAINRLREADAVVLTTHVKPDADGLGSIMALRRWLLSRDTRVEVIVPSVPAEKYAFLDPDGAVHVAGRDVDLSTVARPDLVCIVDTCTWQQLEGVEPLIGDSGAEILVIDHHRTREPLADVTLLDPEAAATVVLVHRMLTLAGVRIDADTARDLFVGLAGDTDWFRLPNAGARTFHLAGSLVEAGACPSRIHAHMNQSDEPSKLHLWGRAVQTLRPALGGRAAVMHLTREMFREVGAKAGDTENLINTCLRVRGTQVGIMLVETGEGEVRVSLRSVPGVNVLQIAERFGGGGHVRAAGARLAGPLEEVEAKVLAAVAAALEAASSTFQPTENA